MTQLTPRARSDGRMLIGVTIALGWPLLFHFVIPAGLAEPARTIVHEIGVWIVTLGVVALMLLGERQPLRSIGLRRPTWRTAAWGLAGLVALALVYGVTRRVQTALGVPDATSAGLAQLARYPAWLRLALVLRAGVAEEILFRGYPIERLSAFTGSRVIGGVLPLLIFTLVHLYFWPPAHLILVFLGGAVLTGLYLWRRDLVANMIAHGLLDFMGVFLAPLAPR